MFQVTTKNLYDLKKDEEGKITYDDDFFGKQASLTVSGQLEGELGATALGAIYTFYRRSVRRTVTRRVTLLSSG